MNRFAMILKSFVLSLAFVGAAFASAGKVDINTADAATIAAALNALVLPRRKPLWPIAPSMVRSSRSISWSKCAASVWQRSTRIAS
jgi:hypothetical protein